MRYRLNESAAQRRVESNSACSKPRENPAGREAAMQGAKLIAAILPVKLPDLKSQWPLQEGG